MSTAKVVPNNVLTQTGGVGVKVLTIPDPNSPTGVEVIANPDPMAESVYTLERLVELAGERRALVCPSLWGANYKPAAFVVNMTGMQIYKLFGIGLFVREKPTKAKKAKTLPKGWEQDFPGGLPPGNEDAAAK